MLLNYASFYEQPQPVPAPSLVPPARVRKPQRRVRPEPQPEPEPERQIVRGTIDCVLPMVEVSIAASATTIPPTPITDIDLDAQDSGIPEDELLLLSSALLLLDDD